MEALFKRYFWVVRLLGIAAIAGLAASALSTGIGSSMLFAAEDGATDEADSDGGDDEEDGDKLNDLLDVTRPKSTSKSFGSSKAAKDRAVEAVRKHNVFCPTCAPAETDPGAGQDSGQAVDAEGRPIGPVIQPGEVRSSLPLKLQATMEASDPLLSLATIEDVQHQTVGVYGVDDVIRSGVVVVGVDQGMVHLRNQAALEYVELGGAVPEPPAPTEDKKTDEKKEDAPKDDRAIPGADEAINCPSENLCIVERTFVEQLIANPMQLAKQARIVPAKDGEVGFKFYGIRKGSLPKLLGLKNGDKLIAVNGEELTGIDQAMGLYTKLRRASNLQVTIERKGKSINKEIQIQ